MGWSSSPCEHLTLKCFVGLHDDARPRVPPSRPLLHVSPRQAVDAGLERILNQPELLKVTYDFETDAESRGASEPTSATAAAGASQKSARSH